MIVRIFYTAGALKIGKQNSLCHNYIELSTHGDTDEEITDSERDRTKNETDEIPPGQIPLPVPVVSLMPEFNAVGSLGARASNQFLSYKKRPVNILFCPRENQAKHRTIPRAR